MMKNTKNNTRRIIAGVDEVGRGPLAGPVTAAVVILNPDKPIEGLKDSKALTPGRREKLAEIIMADSLDYFVASATVEEIDQINILQASLLAMQRAIFGLKYRPEEIMVDGTHCPDVPYPVKAVIQGDKIIPAISAASILAKVQRDAFMVDLDRQYPGYGFAQHKGYGTKVHVEALHKHGVTPMHRKSFRPVSEILGQV